MARTRFFTGTGKVADVTKNHLFTAMNWKDNLEEYRKHLQEVFPGIGPVPDLVEVGVETEIAVEKPEDLLNLRKAAEGAVAASVLTERPAPVGEKVEAPAADTLQAGEHSET